MLVKKESTETDATASTRPGGRRLNPAAIMILLLLIILPAAYMFLSEKNASQKDKSANKPAALVTVGLSKLMDVPVQLKAMAHVEPVQTVAVRTRVDGEIISVLFKEGDYVKQGEAIFQIDPRPLSDAVKKCEADWKQGQADVQQAESALAMSRADMRKQKANLESDQAKEKFARDQWSRYSDLVKQGAVSLDQEEQMRSTANSLSSGLKADQATIDNQKAVIQAAQSKVEGTKAKLGSLVAALDTARLELSYSSVRSPIEGRTGSLMVHQGDMVKRHSENPLVVINQIKPVYVTFSIPEQEMAAVVAGQNSGILPVDITTGEGVESTPIKGELSFLDNTVEKTTGMIMLKARVSNEDKKLWPGQYVTAVLNLRTIKNAVVVPNQAVQIGQKGQYVFVVKPDSTVDMRPVKIERHYKDVALVSEGLQPGERVVLDGQMQLLPGVKVTISSAAQ